MMKTLILLTLTFSFYACTDKITNPDGKFTVEGKIFQNSRPVPTASVEILKNNQTINETITDTNGYYRISDVLADKYTLVASKNYSDGTFVSNTIVINVNGDINLDSLLLPNPVILFPASEVKTSSVTLTWTKYFQNNFYEYKLYRHYNSGLDETTGTLIHVTTNNTDTSFVDTTLSPTTRYFYRLYVNNNYGNLAGSNIIDTLTKTWDNEENFTVFYKATEIAQIPGTGGTIWGVDYDGEFLWILNVNTYGGYYDPKEVRIIKYDFTGGQVVNEFIYNDDYIVPTGLAVRDSSIYVQYGSTVKMISKNTGEIESIHNTVDEVQDISIFGDTLYLTNGYYIQKIALPNFYIGGVIPAPASWGGKVYGIAHRSGEIWLSGRFQDQLIVLSNTGEHIGVVDLNGSFAHLCFMQDKLVVARETGIFIYELSE